MSTSGALSDFGELALAKNYFNNTAPTTPATLYIALFTTSVNDAGSGTEVSGGAYARQAVSCGTSGTGAGAGWSIVQSGTTTIANVNNILFPVCTASWGTIVSIGVFDASSGGNMIWRADLTTPIAITTANVDQLNFPASTLTLVLD